MPILEEGQSVDALYWEHVRRMSPEERSRRALLMFQSTYEAMKSRFRKEYPEKSERELRILLAKRLYGNDPRTRELIELVEKNDK